MKCVILAAGKGERMCHDVPKTLMEYKGLPILTHIIAFWRKHIESFIIVANDKRILDHAKSLEIPVDFVEQPEPKGIAHAIGLVRDLVNEPFLVVLGDCYARGEFNVHPKMDQGVGVWVEGDEEATKAGYGVETYLETVMEVQEKPEEVRGLKCGMGLYFLKPNIFNYIDKAKPTKLRGEIEITNVIQDMIDGGEIFHPVIFFGDYRNINTMGDLHD